MLKNDFIVKVNKSNLVLKADPCTLHDIATVLDHLVNIVHLLKNKATIADNQQARKIQAHQYQINHENHNRSIEIFNRFMKYLNNSCAGNKTMALQEIKNEYHLLSVDARFFISEGRRITKEEEKKRQFLLF